MYRLIEFHQGFDGKIATTESFFYEFDVLTMFIAVVIFVPFWPGRLLRSRDASKEIGMVPLTASGVQ